MALLRFLQDVYAIRDLDGFPEQVGSALQLLIANDYYVYAKVEAQTRQTVPAIDNPPIDSIRERLLLDLVRPHVAQAWQNAEILALTRRALALAGHEIVCLSEERLITFFSERASSLISAYFQSHTSRDNRLPEALDHWVWEQQERFRKASGNISAPPPLVVDRDGKRLAIRFLRGGGDGQDDILLIDEQQVRVSPASLTAIGLSHREAEVLSLVIQGRSVAEISQTLAISTSTVEKHLENVYTKLNVHSRSAAIVRALDAVNAGK